MGAEASVVQSPSEAIIARFYDLAHHVETINRILWPMLKDFHSHPSVAGHIWAQTSMKVVPPVALLQTGQRSLVLSECLTCSIVGVYLQISR